MANENTEVISLQIDASQIDICLSRMTEAIGQLRDTVADLGESITSVINEFLQMPNTIAGIESVGEMINDVYEDYVQYGENFNLFKSLVPESTEALSSISSNIRTLWETVSGGIIGGLGSIFSSIGSLFGGMNIGLTLAIVAIVGAIILLIQHFDEIKAALLPIWEEHLKPLWDNLCTFLSSVGENLKIIWDSVLKPLIDWILSVLEPIVMAVIDVVMGALDAAIGFFSDIISSIMQILDGVIQFIAGVFSGDWERAWDGIVKVFKGIFEYIVTIIKGVVNRCIWTLNLLIGAIYSAIAGVVNGLGGIVEAVGNLIGQEWGFSMPTHPPQIPYLAQGAVLPANRPFLAMVGDQKHGTNVEAPLATMQEALANVLAQQGMGGDIHITFTGDLAQLGRGDLSVLGSIGWRKPGFPKADS